MEAAKDCFRIIDSCLSCYYHGESHMYKPLATQLRMLLCDSDRGEDKSLLHRLFPDIRLLAFRRIEWQRAPESPLAFAMEPFKIVKKKNDLEIADWDMADPPRRLGLPEWREQVVTYHPTELRIVDIIRCVADKDGGAHYDDKAGHNLAAMRRSGPTELKLNVLFLIATGRYVQRLGRQMIEDWERQAV